MFFSRIFFFFFLNIKITGQLSHSYNCRQIGCCMKIHTNLFTIYKVVIMSTEASFDGDGVIAGDDGGCRQTGMPRFPTEFFNTISMFVNADET